MGYGNRDKPARKSGHAGFVDARLEELRRGWENATDEREKTEVSEQIRESFRPEGPRHPAVDNRSSCNEFSWTKARVVEDIWRNSLRFRPLQKYEVSKCNHCEGQNGSRQNSECEPVPKRSTRCGQPQHMRGKVGLIEVVRVVSVPRPVCHGLARDGREVRIERMYLKR